MKNIFLLLASIILLSCTSDDPENDQIIPVLTTSNVINVTLNTAMSGGNITSNGGADITARGLVWSTSQNPTIALTTKTVDGTGSGSFISSISGLTPNTSFYVRAYASNSVGQKLSQPETIKVKKGKENLYFEQYAQEHPRREQALSAWNYLEKIYA
jgi:hypothetical protein